MAKYEFTSARNLTVIGVASFEKDPESEVYRFATDDADVAAELRKVEYASQVSGPEPKSKGVKQDGDN